MNWKAAAIETTAILIVMLPVAYLLAWWLA